MLRDNEQLLILDAGSNRGIGLQLTKAFLSHSASRGKRVEMTGHPWIYSRNDFVSAARVSKHLDYHGARKLGVRRKDSVWDAED